MDWARLPAYLTGTVDQELLLRNEYLAAENHNRLLASTFMSVLTENPIQHRERLGDILISYDREAARKYAFIFVHHIAFGRDMLERARLGEVCADRARRSR